MAKPPALKLKWKVDPKSTGLWAIGNPRRWPTADFKAITDPMKSHAAAQIICSEAYTPGAVKSGNHPPLKVLIADYTKRNDNTGGWDWRTLTKRFTTLDEAKQGVLDFYSTHPSFLPTDLQG
jgi:hypothetical protein